MKHQAQVWGKCDHCEFWYDIGPHGIKQEGSRCEDMSYGFSLPMLVKMIPPCPGLILREARHE